MARTPAWFRIELTTHGIIIGCRPPAVDQLTISSVTRPWLKPGHSRTGRDQVDIGTGKRARIQPPTRLQSRHSAE